MAQFQTLPCVRGKPETTAASRLGLPTAHLQALRSLMNKGISCFYTEFSTNVEKRPGFFYAANTHSSWTKWSPLG